MINTGQLVAILCMLVPEGPVDGNTDPTAGGVYRMPEVVVEAPRPVTTVGGASALETHVDSLSVPVAATVDDVVRELPLLHVRTNSRGESELSARGSESRQVAVLVDGVPITLAWDARADVSVIPATALTDITFIRGLSSMLYGPNVLGGIVLVGVGQGEAIPERRSLQLSLGTDHVGSFGTTVTTTLPFQAGSGAGVLRAGAGFSDTPGAPRARGVVEPVEVGDDLRLNTDAQNVNGFLAARYRSDDGAWLSLSGTSFREARGIAAELGVTEADARLWRYPHVSRTLAVMSGGTGQRPSPLGGHGDLEASVGLDLGRTEIDAYTSRAYDQLDAFEDGKDRTLTVRLLADQTLGPRGDLRGAFTMADIHHDESIPEGDFEYRQKLTSGALESAWRLAVSSRARRVLALSVGVAYDAAKTPKTGGREALGALSQWGGRVGVSALLAGGRTVLHAGTSRRGRFPALRELYSGALSRFAPNPELQPETLTTGEAGVTQRLGDGELQAVLFHHRLDDAVVRITLEDRRFMRVNRDRLTSTGVELLATQRLGRAEIAGSFTAQNVDLTDESAGETHHPENLPAAFGELSLALPLALGIIGEVSAAYTGTQFCIDPNTGGDAQLAAQAIFDARITRTWPVAVSWGAGSFSRLTARLAIDNVGDVALYDAYGLPEPGRLLRFELALR